MPHPWKPTASDLDAARGKRLRDVLAPDLNVLFCGINPSLYSAAVGHHFARPGNRFWPTLHRSGFTPRLLSPFEDRLLLPWGCGLTNLVGRATARAEELSPEELIEGARILKRKVRRWRPSVVAFLGIATYRTAFDVKRIALGKQETGWGGADVWVLPNPSGLNAHYQLDELAALFQQLRAALP